MSINVGQAVAYLTLDISQFSSGMSEALGKLQDIENASSKITTKLQSFGSALSTAGSTLTKTVTLPIAGIGTAAVNVAGDFDASMSKVQAISGATALEMEDLRDKAIEMGAKTKFSAKESADAFTYMAMAGWDAGQMIDGIGGIMSLAAADGLDLATTSDIVTDALTAFGLKASDTARFADVLAQASSASNTSVSMLGESFKYIAPVAGALGMSVEDVSVALGLMANSGIKSSQAGTTLRAALTNLVKPTDKMQGTMEKLGIEVTNSDGTMRSLDEIIQILRKSFSGLTESEKASAAAILFGKEAMSGMLAVITASEEDYNKLSAAINNAAGTADSMAEVMMDNLPGAIEQMKGAIESLLIKLGEALVPTIREITEFITRLVEQLNTLTDEEIEQIVQIAAIVAAVGPVLAIVGKVVTIIANVITVGSKLLGGIKALVTFISGVLIPAISSIGAPVLVVIGVITALIAAGVALYKNWDEVSAWAKKTWSAITETIGNAIDAIGEFFTKLGEGIAKVVSDISTWLSDLWNSITQFFSDLIASVGDWLNSVWQTVTDFIDELLTIGSRLVGFFANILTMVGEFFSELFSNIVRAIEDILDAIIEWGSNLVSTAVEIGSNFVRSFAEAFSNLVNSVVKFVEDFITMIVNWGNRLLSKAAEIGNGFTSAITSGLQKVGHFFSEIFNDIIDTVTNLLPKMVEAGSKIITNLWEGMKTVFTSLANWLSSSLSNLFAPLSRLLDNLFSPVKSLFSSVGSFFSGSHANGLDYVPYNGYIAQLHEGERVLTKQENEEYNNSNDNRGGGDTFNFYNTKPDPYEYARQMKRAKKELEDD